jgi:hypothetical protein
MIAILHGPSLDDGICIEIGFAAALPPTVALPTSAASRPGGLRVTISLPASTVTSLRSAPRQFRPLGVPQP